MVHTRSVRAGNSSLPHGQGQPSNNLPPLIPPQLPPQVPTIFSPIDHAEGGDENQPHISAHNLTSTVNQDAVTAQLAAMQQQFGVFQLVLAQLLARNNPGDPLINLLNPTQQPPAPQQNPQPVQPAPAISESQDQSHIAPAQQPIPDDVTRRLDSLEKLIAEHRGAPPPQHATDSILHPLNTNITLEPYPTGFKIPQLETYDGMKDPDDHLHAFYSCMQAQNASNALMCKIFPSTLRVEAVISGLKHDRFRDSLIKHAATTFSENPEWRDDNPSRNRMRMVQNRGPVLTSPPRFGRSNSTPPQQSAGKPPVNWTPFNLPRSQIFMQIKNKMDLRRPGPMRTTAASRDHTRYCDFHQDHGHTTEQCNSLKSELESLAQKGMLNEYVQRAEQPRFVREQRLQPQGARNPPNRQGVGYQQTPPPLPPPARIIHMITGGLEVVVTPHNDPLVTSVMINNYEVQRVLVDTGSAPDIMYFHCFESLGLDPALLQKYDGPIYGFNNQPVLVEGVLTLHVAFGRGRTYVTPSVRFLVVKMASSFNIVIGRLTLTEIRAVVSQSHLCMKFPTPMGIATLRGNQEVARHCYITSVTQPLKGKAQTPEAIPQQISDNQQIMGVEIVDNRPEDETRAAPVEDVEEVLIDDRDPNMPGIPNSVSQHKLSTNPLKKPVAQKRRLFGGERLQAIKEEVTKVLQAGFVRKVDYCEWVANPVLVPMALEDEEKIAFYAGNEIYCYVMIPFGLKNACATYQKMVTIVFHAQIGKNLEVYVDDIVVKSLKAEDHLVDLDETFNNLKKNRMQLNPAKCIFGVESGKFLGFMVSRRGIEVNPEKIRAIAEMEPPKSVKDIQRLTGRVAALHRFISKSADKCLPFFKIMRSAAQKDESGKQKKFEWSRECQAAFEELKSYLSSPPLLTKAVHEGVCGSHVGARTLAHKVLRQGYCWPNMYKDATYFVQKCLKCQFFAHLTHQPTEELTNLAASWPFAQWGLDLLGPFVKGVGGVTHLIVGVDYFTKWVEARPLSSLTSKKVEDFGFSSIIYRYWIPNQIVADNGTQFNYSSFRDFCSSYGIKLQFTSVYHPESNGMVESINKCILEGIRPRLEQQKAKWADELNNVLWAYRTTSRTATGETPYHLAFGTEAVIFVEIGVPSFRVTHFDEGQNGQLLRENLDLLAEVREGARLRTLVYKQKLANLYNKRVRPRTFKVGDLVLKKVGLTGFETRFGKLAPNWEGPYAVAEVPHPGAYILPDAEGKRVPRVWNVNNLKKFYP
ncbi:hypothetical protein SLEP1_g49817 [Rubroshorea leprosula]|uniref:Integrase catalytic domain-containing protein n=1 Tax=Rubroshorea leprosula TaxID=152421 RepID=A0AAV5M0A6_9ROSI|nr:hypothetical protein SLEP1_g49817 [Rubroshorea leprosula]